MASPSFSTVPLVDGFDVKICKLQKSLLIYFICVIKGNLDFRPLKTRLYLAVASSLSQSIIFSHLGFHFKT